MRNINSIATGVHFALFGGCRGPEDKASRLQSAFNYMNLSVIVRHAKVGGQRGLIYDGKDRETATAFCAEVKSRAGLIGEFYAEVGEIKGVLEQFRKEPKSLFFFPNPFTWLSKLAFR